MLSGVCWNQPVCLFMCLSAYNILVSVKALAGVLTLSQTSPGFYSLQYKSFENTVGKGEIARNEQFLLFPQCFSPI